ncbi:MAG TPA: helicase HerA-like domain-containing protein [Chthoniobacter sp.]|nr:helicase HerA-like domain-containing protein [Chthoniobacter sp.]
MSEPFLLAKGTTDLFFTPRMGNRHGLIAGATGTGKTITLQTLAENFSALGVPVFLADIKGDLSGMAKAGSATPKVAERLKALGITDHAFTGYPVTFWDIFGKSGHPIRATISEMGPLLLSRVLNLNDTQEGVLQLLFKVADDHGLLLLDLEDLREMLKFIAENASQFTVEYGNISSASVGTIQRALLQLDQQGGAKFFGEPALNLDDFLQTGPDGKGVINILASDQLMQNPRTYATALLWMLSELFEKLPEVGDLDKPKLVFFFDEAHLLFTDLPKEIEDKIEQVVRLIRSKGVGVYFITQNPIDVPERILGQLGNRVQHALRAFSPRDQKAVQSAAETFRQNPKLDVAETITQLAVGEALVSLLDETGTPAIVERALIVPPHSQIGPITPGERDACIKQSVIYGTYETAVDRESAAEILQARAAARTGAAPVTSSAPGPTSSSAPAQPRPLPGDAPAAQPATGGGLMGTLGNILFGTTGPRGGRHEGLIETMAKSATRSATTQITRQVMRGVLGGIFGSKR